MNVIVIVIVIVCMFLLSMKFSKGLTVMESFSNRILVKKDDIKDLISVRKDFDLQDVKRSKEVVFGF